MLSALGKKAFSLIEMVMVILIIGIFAGIAIPKFMGFQREAAQASEDASVHSIRSGIKIYGVNSALKNRTPYYPVSLDTASAGYATPANQLFEVVLQNPIADYKWRKIGDTRYVGPANNYYVYDPVEGDFNRE